MQACMQPACDSMSRHITWGVHENGFEDPSRGLVSATAPWIAQPSPAQASVVAQRAARVTACRVTSHGHGLSASIGQREQPCGSRAGHNHTRRVVRVGRGLRTSTTRAMPPPPGTPPAAWRLLHRGWHGGGLSVPSATAAAQGAIILPQSSTCPPLCGTPRRIRGSAMPDMPQCGPECI